jgi:DNA-binding NarL/FixJ family response regulator
MGVSTCIRVMIVDDHYMVREGLKVFLSTSDQIEVVAEAESGVDAVARIGDVQPDVVLMDVVMPGMDGATATAQLLGLSPELKVIALTSYVDEDLVQRTLQAGAISYMLKDAGPEKLAQAIVDAYHGRGSIDTSAMQTLMRRQQEPPRQDYGLTPREKQVLSLLAAGRSNKEIGLELNLSAGTVRLHVSNVLAKLDVPNRTSAALLATKSGLVE